MYNVLNQCSATAKRAKLPSWLLLTSKEKNEETKIITNTKLIHKARSENGMEMTLYYQ